MDQKALLKGIYDALAAVFPQGVGIIAADQNEPRPQRPYATFKIINGPVREGWDDETMDENMQLEFSGTRILTVSINYYGQYALQGLALLQSRLQFPSIRDILMGKNLVYVSDSGVRDISLLLETQTETRAQMDLTMRYLDVSVDVDTGAIESVEIEGKIDGVEQEKLIIDSQGDN